MRRVVRICVWLFAGLCVVLAGGVWAQFAPSQAVPSAAPAAPATGFARWEPEIARFEAADKKNPPESGAVLFVGSSSIRRWNTLAEDFPGVPVLNHGFGGSAIADSTHFADRIVVPYRPRMVVLYAGDNDLAAGKTPMQVAEDFRQFVTRVREGLASVPIVFIAIKPSIARWKLRQKIQDANALIRRIAARDPKVTFVDVYRPMLGPDGTPRPELYVADGLHMTPAGYRLWTTVLAPILKGEMASAPLSTP